MRYRARVEYDGTDFCGFQSQPTARTVQGVLEEALASVAGGRRVRITAAGRTDAGVHALDQVIAFDYAGRLGRGDLQRALDALLPRDVAIRGLRPAVRGFQPRRALWREYRYSIWNGPRSPLRERTALGLRERLDEAAMARAAEALVGRHDFRAFGGPVGRHGVRTVHWIRVRRSGSAVTVDIAADAFLRQMIRAIAAALIRVGRGGLEAEELTVALSRPSGRAFGGEVAPAKGLCLRRIVYGPRQRNERRSNGER